MSGALQWLGVMLVAAAAAMALLAPSVKQRAQAMGVAVAVLPPLLLAELWNRPELKTFRDSPSKPIIVTILVLAGIIALVRLFERRPDALPLAIVAVLPFRVPLGTDANTANLLLPLYVVIAAGVIVSVRSALSAEHPAEGDGRPARGVADWLLIALSASVVLYAVQAAYSNDLDKATETVGFFLVPFALMLRLLLDCKWTPRLFALALWISVGEALVFAVVGYGQAITRHLFWNSEVITANDFQRYFRVNSLFWDPNILGRYLAIVTVALAASLLWARERRTALLFGGAIAVLFGCLVLTYSQSSYAALTAGLVVLAALRWSVRWTALVASASLIVAVVAALAFGSNVKFNFSSARALDRTTAGRSDLVRGGLELGKRRPVWGFGSGSFQRSFEKESARHTKVAASHTEPVTVIAEQGALGLIAYLALLSVAFATLFGRMRGVMPGFGRRSTYVDGDWGIPPPRTTILGRALVAAAFAALVVHTMAYAAFLSDPLTWTLLAFGIVLARPVAAPTGVVAEPIAPPIQPPAPPIQPPTST